MTPINIYGTSDNQFRSEVHARFAEPVTAPTATIATLAALYPAATWPGAVVYISNGASNKFMAISNGTAWYYPDGAAV